MEALAEACCSVLPLVEAIQRLRDNTLPARAVAITFDDGFHDVYRVAMPIIESYKFPVTLYLTTYYVGFNRPVFDPMCSYLLWKGRGKEQLNWPSVFPAAVSLDSSGREQATEFLRRYAMSHGFSAQQKDDLLVNLAERLDVDYQKLCQQRILHLINEDEAKELAARGVDLQYHTHRHRVCRSRDCLFTELQDNLREIRKFSPKEPRDFCYPYGYHVPEYIDYLKEYGIRSATTCASGLCTSQTNLLALPRLVDTAAVTDLEFRSWLAGTAALIPRRSDHTAEGVHLEEPPLTALKAQA
jgi:peptidoglycan/xylan/chitin deacetylase (PgdA/CDA1 family)